MKAEGMAPAPRKKRPLAPNVAHEPETLDSRLSTLDSRLPQRLSHLSHRLKNLETKGLIERAPDAEDRRIVNITITDAGRRLVDEVAPAHVTDVRRLVFDHLDGDEVEVLAESLGRLADNLGSFPPRRTPS